jgi:hypothetical protein
MTTILLVVGGVLLLGVTATCVVMYLWNIIGGSFTGGTPDSALSP